MTTVVNAINGLQAGGNTGLYNTTWAACQDGGRRTTCRTRRTSSSLLTDGADDNNVAGGLTLDALADQPAGYLRRPRPSRSR